MSCLVLLCLLCGPGAVLGSQSPNSVQDPGTPSSLDFPDVVYAVKDEELEEFCLPPPHSAYADFAATVLAYLPNRRLLTPRLGGGHAPRALSL